MKLFNIWPEIINGSYNHQDLDYDDSLYMQERNGYFIRDKGGVKLELSPYSPNLLVKATRGNVHIERPYLGVQSGFIISEELETILQNVRKARHVKFPLFIKYRNKIYTKYYYYFYSSNLEYIDLKHSKFHWVEPQSYYDESGVLRTKIVSSIDNLTIERLKRDYRRKVEGLVIWCEKISLKNYFQKFDLFELELFNEFYLTEKVVGLIEKSGLRLDIQESTTEIVI